MGACAVVRISTPAFYIPAAHVQRWTSHVHCLHGTRTARNWTLSAVSPSFQRCSFHQNECPTDGSTSTERHAAGKTLLYKFGLCCLFLISVHTASDVLTANVQCAMQVATVAELAWASLAGLLLQMLLAWPFLVQAPVPYLTRAFQLSRAFSHVWSVNLKFLPEHIFLSQKLALGLLIVHVILLLAFAQICLHRQSGGIAGLLQRFVSSFSTPKLSRHLGRQPPAGRAFGAVLAGNFIGVLCARSLHFQFYCWYCHSLPFLLWQTRLGCCRKVVLWLCIELIWNIYPSSGLSSVALQACHLVLLAAMFADSNAWHL